MILLRARIHLDPRHRAKVLQSLTRILEPTRMMPGCVSCHLYCDIEDDHVLVMVEQWADEKALAERLRSEGMRVLLSAMDFACEPPEVLFEATGNTRGMELITACRACDLQQ